MTHLTKVVWSEGMHLAQHHFQAQSRFFGDAVDFALSHLFFSAYGLAGIELDADALRNGSVSLLHARGIMPDGLAFHMPDGDALPEPRDIRELFSPTQESHLVLLTVPAYRAAGENCALDGDVPAAPVRYVAEERMVVDELTGRDAKPVRVGRKNFRLVLDAELDDGAVSLPVARVRRDGLGGFVYDEAFVPPCVRIGASPWLVGLLQRLVGMLDEKSTALAGDAHSGRHAAGELARHEVATFWLLHAIHSALGPLRHQLAAKRAHPEALYTEMARLAGALCTFALDAHPQTLPAYDHEHLGECFDALDRHIRAHLEIVIPTNCVTIPLQRTESYLYTGRVSDPRCFNRARWLFGLRSSLNAAEVVARVPGLVKICAAKFTPELVRRAYPGLALEHVPVPPAAISPQIGMQYFSIAGTGPCWEALLQTHDVGVYVPDTFPNPEIELVALLES
ncbi:MAG TPA: type VI secretion system baseplate subunit TssK [Gemmatimonadaceae bacterium]|nr:type VI secretion system baseplate subunit TssK [Gemmatimonadaceae bacterium]